jgi:hypothetical protein
MSIALVHETSLKLPNGGSATKTITIPATTAGNALRLLLASIGTAGVLSVSGGGVTWTKLSSTASGGGSIIELWGGDNSSGGSTSVSATFASAYPGANIIVKVSEWSSMPTTAVPDGGPSTAASSATPASPSTPSVTPTAGKNVLLLAALQAYTQTVTAGPTGGFTGLTIPTGDAGNSRFAYQLVASASGSYAAGWTCSASYGGRALLIAGWDGTTGGGGGGGSQEESYWGGWHG